MSRNKLSSQHFRLFAQVLLCFNSILVFACSTEPATLEPDMPNPAIRFLALGDSYTIGEGVDPAERWPVQLVTALQAEGLSLGDPTIIARTGWTTGDLLTAIETNPPQGSFNMVTLLIGVNNQYQGKDPEFYRADFQILLGVAIDFAGGDPTRVLVISIPDWGVTPFAQGRDQAQISAEINQFNAINQEESLAAGVQYLDVTPNSRQAADDISLLAPDKLHPSEKMYAAWVNLMLPVVRNILYP